MSLVQVMIALGLMSVIGLGVADLMVTSANINKRSDIKVSQLVLLNELQSVITNKDACKETVTSFTQPQKFSKSQATSSDGWNIKFNIGGKEIKSGTEITNGLTLSKVYFHITTDPANQPYPSTVSGAGEYLGQVMLKFQTDKGVVGGQVKDKQVGTMYLTVHNTSKNVLGCAKEPQTTVAQICKDLGGSYNNGNCQNFKFASCRNGYKHGDSYTRNYTSNGDQCRESIMCVDGNFHTTSDFCVSGNGGGGTTIINQQPSCTAGYYHDGNNCVPMTCFTADTKIKMFDGSTLPISEVKHGDYVLGEDGAVNFVYDIETVSLGDRKLYSLNGGPHFITEEHPIKTTNGWKSFNPIRTLQEHAVLNRDHLFNLDPQPLTNKDTLLKSSYQQEQLIYYTSIRDDQTMKVYNLRLMAAPGSPFNDSDDRSNTYFANGYLVHNK